MECINRSMENNLLAAAMVDRLMQAATDKPSDEIAFAPPRKSRAERRARERAEKKAEKRAVKQKEVA